MCHFRLILIILAWREKFNQKKNYEPHTHTGTRVRTAGLIGGLGTRERGTACGLPFVLSLLHISRVPCGITCGWLFCGHQFGWEENPNFRKSNWIFSWMNHNHREKRWREGEMDCEYGSVQTSDSPRGFCPLFDGPDKVPSWVRNRAIRVYYNLLWIDTRPPRPPAPARFDPGTRVHFRLWHLIYSGGLIKLSQHTHRDGRRGERSRNAR